MRHLRALLATQRVFRNQFYRPAAGLTVSSLGLGTYLGGLDERGMPTPARWPPRSAVESIFSTRRSTTGISARSARSGRPLTGLFASGEFQRDEIVVCTKAGFLTPGAVDPATLRDEDVVRGMHSMAPDFLADQIERSRANLGLETLDVFYLHNPETQLAYISRERSTAAFARRSRAWSRSRPKGRSAGTAPPPGKAFARPRRPVAAAPGRRSRAKWVARSIISASSSCRSIWR